MPHRASRISRLCWAAHLLGVLLCGTKALAVPVAAQQPAGVSGASAPDERIDLQRWRVAQRQPPTSQIARSPPVRPYR